MTNDKFRLDVENCLKGFRSNRWVILAYYNNVDDFKSSNLARGHMVNVKWDPTFKTEINGSKNVGGVKFLNLDGEECEYIHEDVEDGGDKFTFWEDFDFESKPSVKLFIYKNGMIERDHYKMF